MTAKSAWKSDDRAATELDSLCQYAIQGVHEASYLEFLRFAPLEKPGAEIRASLHPGCDRMRLPAHIEARAGFYLADALTAVSPSTEVAGLTTTAAVPTASTGGPTATEATDVDGATFGTLLSPCGPAGPAGPPTIAGGQNGTSAARPSIVRPATGKSTCHGADSSALGCASHHRSYPAGARRWPSASWARSRAGASSVTCVTRASKASRLLPRGADRRRA